MKIVLVIVATFFAVGAAADLPAQDPSLTLFVVLAALFGGATRGVVERVLGGMWLNGLMLAFIGSCCGIFIGANGIKLFADKALGLEELGVAGATFISAYWLPSIIMKGIKPIPTKKEGDAE